MKAMVFAAGRGTRLRPFTDSHPKALAEVAGVPMLGRVLRKLRDAGISRVTVNVHHFASQVRDYLATCPVSGLDVTVSDESDLLLDTGGGLVHALPSLAGDEPILIHNTDILSEIDPADMLREHISSGADATMLVEARSTSRYLLFDSEGNLHGWKNVTTGQVRPDGLARPDSLEPLAFGGIHIISPRVLSDLAEYARTSGREVFSIIDYYIDRCERFKFHAYRKSEGIAWFDIGDNDKLAKAREYAATHPNI